MRRPFDTKTYLQPVTEYGVAIFKILGNTLDEGIMDQLKVPSLGALDICNTKVVIGLEDP